MTIVQRLMAYALIALALAGAGAWAAWEWQANAYGKQLATQKAAYQSDLTMIANASNAQLRAQHEKRLNLESNLASLDAKHHKDITDAQQENDRLQQLYSGADGERKRLRIEVTVARNDARVCTATSSGSVGDGASFELSEQSGRSVWGIRRGMTEDKAKIEYLQDYVCELRPDLSACKGKGS